MNFDGEVICAVRDEMGARGERCQWPTTRVSWHASFAIGGLNQADVKGAFTEAFSWWADVCGIQPEYTENPRTAHIFADSGGIDGPSGTLAWSELPCGNAQNLNQKYDDTESWVIAANPPPNKLDFTRVVAHEIGHALGIPHINDGNLMAPRYSARIRKPQRGDVTEAQARYGQSSPGDPGNENGGDICETCEVLLRAFGFDEEIALRGGRHARMLLKDLEVGMRRLKQGSSEPES